MSTDIDTIDTRATSATVGDALTLFQRSRHHALPVVDTDGRCVALLTEGDTYLHHVPKTSPALSIASRDLVVTQPDDTVLQALERMVHEDLSQLPVVADGHLGLCTRLDVLRVSELQAEGEATQPGWIYERFGSPTASLPPASGRGKRRLRQSDRLTDWT